ncbi:MAG: hypothetical protein GX958_07335 [Desulfitobacterium sp.]|nr:hypothetical protein [Desulfitobacterium sp.]
MKKGARWLFILHVFVGLGAILGGMMAFLNPESPGGIDIGVLEHSPFDNFLIPGIILFVVIGLGSFSSALAIIFKWKYQSYISILVSLALVIWIVVQCLMLRMIIPLHVIFFFLGIVGVIISVMQINARTEEIK